MFVWFKPTYTNVTQWVMACRNPFYSIVWICFTWLPRTRQMCLHSHTSPIRQCDNDMLITVVRGHYREAGTVPDGAFNKILWGEWCILSFCSTQRESCQRQTHSSQHKADLLDGTSHKCQFLNSVAERCQGGGGIKTTFFKIYSSQWSSFKTSCKSKLGYWTVPKAQTCIHHNIWRRT